MINALLNLSKKDLKKRIKGSFGVKKKFQLDLFFKEIV